MGLSLKYKNNPVYYIGSGIYQESFYFSNDNIYIIDNKYVNTFIRTYCPKLLLLILISAYLFLNEINIDNYVYRYDL